MNCKHGECGRQFRMVVKQGNSVITALNIYLKRYKNLRDRFAEYLGVSREELDRFEEWDLFIDTFDGDISYEGTSVDSDEIEAILNQFRERKVKP